MNYLPATQRFHGNLSGLNTKEWWTKATSFSARRQKLRGAATFKNWTNLIDALVFRRSELVSRWTETRELLINFATGWAAKDYKNTCLLQRLWSGVRKWNFEMRIQGANYFLLTCFSPSFYILVASYFVFLLSVRASADLFFPPLLRHLRNLVFLSFVFYNSTRCAEYTKGKFYQECNTPRMRIRVHFQLLIFRSTARLGFFLFFYFFLWRRVCNIGTRNTLIRTVKNELDEEMKYRISIFGIPQICYVIWRY